MFALSIRSHFPELRPTLKRGVSCAADLTRLVLVTGPSQLLTERISGKCAVLMILLCIPSLVVCAMLTLPGLMFQSPQQHAYYYFALMLGQTPLRWIAFSLAACCTVFSLALPATIDRK